MAALEDKVVQKAVVDNILTPIYEAVFLGFSYGFRPGRGAHNALDAIAVGIERRKINWILDADVTKFFDRIDRAKLLELLGETDWGQAAAATDRQVVARRGKWRTGSGSTREGGTPQGSVISPVLSNSKFGPLGGFSNRGFQNEGPVSGDLTLRTPLSNI